MSDAIRHFAERVRQHPNFLGGVLAAYQLREGMSDDDMRRWLRRADGSAVGLPPAALRPDEWAGLQLCGKPRHITDVEAIAGRFGVDVPRLAEACGIE